MPSPFLYFAGERLSLTELASARLDGDLVEVGDAYMPTDAVETVELRAASLRASVPDAVAVTRQSAAWVHGATPDAPVRHTVQRRSSARPHHVLDPRLAYRDQLLEAEAVVCVAGLWTTTPERTLADLVRLLCAGEDVSSSVEALLAWRPGIAAAALRVLERGRAVHYKRPALAYLRARTEQAGDGQEEVTRYTS